MQAAAAVEKKREVRPEMAETQLATGQSVCDQARTLELIRGF
jgi:hypothetical protein